MFYRRVQPIVSAALLVVLPACGPRAALTLIQPYRAGGERRLELASEEARFFAEKGLARYMIDLPLPGATTGRHYRVYLCLSDADGDRIIGTPLGESGFEGGFLIETVGGRTKASELSAGIVRVSGAGLGRARTRRGEVRVQCGDGSRIEGHFTAAVDRIVVTRFERASPDAQALMGMRGGERENRE